MNTQGVETTLLDLTELPSSLFSPGAYDTKPKAFQAFADAVVHSDGLYVVAPEYNGSFPGALKLFIDHLPFPESFEGRPVAFTGVAAGQFGNLRGIEHLQSIFGYRNAHIFPQRLFIKGATQALNSQGELTDEQQQNRLTQQVNGYLDFVRTLKGLT
jgi:NAD(P)H-dependent FMN reductase